MALLVYLPMTANLNNNGISNVTVTNSGVTLADNQSRYGGMKCGYFNGSSRIQITLPIELTTIKNTTVAAWVKSISSTLALGGISHNSTPNYYDCGCTLYSSGWQTGTGSSWAYVSGGTVANTNVWHHVACTIDDTNVTTYLDGVQVVTKTLSEWGMTSFSLNSTQHFIEIGSDYPGGDEFMTGYINDFRVYNECLSARKIAQLAGKQSPGLQVWLPLNGDLRNQGISSVTTTVSGTTSYAAGKIGQGLSCNGSSFWTITGLTLENEASIACWSKTTVNGKMQWVLTSTASDRLNLYESDIYTLNTGDGNANPFKDGSNNNISCLHDGNWHHFVVTFGSNIAKLYIDGEYKGTAVNFRSPATTSAKTIKIAGGYSGGHTYDWNGMINDFRVYDYCLSPEQIKWLSKGLILHYRLDRNSWGQENLLKDTDFNGISQKFTLSSGTEGGFTYTSSITISANTTYTVSCYIRGNANMTLYKLCTGGDEAVTWINRNDLSTTEYKKFFITFTSPGSSKQLNQIYICTRYGNSNVGDWFEIKPYSLKMEFGSKSTPWCPNSSDTLYYQMRGSYPVSKYDSNIYSESDGSLWTKIAHHNNPAGGVFSSSDTFTTGVYKDVDKWYDVERISGLVNKWEYMVKQKDTSSSSEIKYRWIQTKSPINAVWADVSPSSGNITHITTSEYSTSTTGGGIYVSPSASTRITIANSNNGNWYGGIGTFTAYQGGIPGYPNTTCTTGYVDLYIRIDNINNIEHDGSGFSYDGTRIGTFTWTSDTPKYEVSTKFISSQITANALTSEVKTLACWVKTTASKSTSQFVVADSASNMCISFYSGCIIGVFGSIRSTGSKSTLGSSYIENDWNHIVVVKTGDSGERAIYCNGVLLTPTSDDYWSVTTGFFVSGRNTSNALPMQGYICDVRAYATAFSASDVLALYNNTAALDASGNILGPIR